VGQQPDKNELLTLARRLYARRQTAAVVPYKMLDPGHLEGECHQNSERWARDNSGWKAIDGWLVFDYTSLEPLSLPLVQFNPHSVVEDENGTRVDVTPSRASQRYPFLEHEGPRDDFIRIVENISLIRIDYDVMNDDISIVTR
jgi:hypothetical protein